MCVPVVGLVEPARSGGVASGDADAASSPSQAEHVHLADLRIQRWRAVSQALAVRGPGQVADPAGLGDQSIAGSQRHLDCHHVGEAGSRKRVSDLLTVGSQGGFADACRQIHAPARGVEQVQAVAAEKDVASPAAEVGGPVRLERELELGTADCLRGPAIAGQLQEHAQAVGRPAECVRGDARDPARKPVLVHDPDTFAGVQAEGLGEGADPVPEAAVGAGLEGDLGAGVEGVAVDVQRGSVDAELVWRRRLEQDAGRDHDAPAVTRVRPQ